MINKVLNPSVVLAALAALAILTPVVCFIVYRFRPALLSRRPALVIGLSGPAALGYWFFHNAVLGAVGFDSIWSALIVIGVAAAIGLAAGSWAGRENRPSR
jgi:hypothetical protein